jgi:Concanavalin A-like lectin/glucanases superfamily
MKLSRLILGCITLVTFSMVFNACQKMERPELGELVLDPDPPPYEPLKSFWAFEGNANDAGENKLTPVSSNVSYVAGVTGQAVKIGDKGYIAFKGMDTVRYPNGFVGLSADTLRNLGSFTYSFWMNVPGPVQGGAQGVFAISHKTQFWGNMEVFLENWSNAADPSEVFLKVHMFNAGVASGNGEQWNEVKIPGVLNKWSHIAIVYDGATSQFSIYANGTVVPGFDKKVLAGGAYNKIKYNDFNGMVLGSFAFQTNPSMTNHGPEDWAKSLNGSLDQFRLYNKALTAAEIQTLYTTKQ